MRLALTVRFEALQSNNVRQGWTGPRLNGWNVTSNIIREREREREITRELFEEIMLSVGWWEVAD